MRQPLLSALVINDISKYLSFFSLTRYLCTIKSYESLLSRSTNYFLAHFTTLVSYDMDVLKWARCMVTNHYQRSTSYMGGNQNKQKTHRLTLSLMTLFHLGVCSVPCLTTYHFIYRRWEAHEYFFTSHQVTRIKDKTFPTLVTPILFFIPSFERNRFIDSRLNFFLMTLESVLRGI